MTPDRHELLAAVDLGALLEELTGLNARGTAYPCPNREHEQTGQTPPATVSQLNGYQVFHCFSCDVGGTAVDALKLAHGLGTAEAFLELRKRAGVGSAPAPRPRAPERPPEPLPTDQQIADWTKQLVGDDRRREWLATNRGWAVDVISRLRVGYDGQRITLPIVDRGGTLVNLARYNPRPQNGARKMLSLAGRPRDLWPPPESIDGEEAVIVEGEADGLTLLSLGLPAVGLPGVEFAKRLDASRFARFRRVIILLDCDAQGRQAASKIEAALSAAGTNVHVVDLDESRDDGYDVGDLVGEAAQDGAAGLAQARQLLERIVEQAPPAVPVSPTDNSDRPSEWLPLNSRSLPGFPVDALAQAVAAWVERTALHTQTPADLAALAALGVLSAAALGAAVVDCGAWEEELALYLLAAMPSGDRKSTVLRTAVQPLRDIERERQEAARPAVRELRNRRDVLETRTRRLIKVASDAQDALERAEAEQELEKVGDELERIGEPAVPRLLANDATPEALGGLLARHGSIAVIAAESAFIDNIAGRYSEGKANLHLVCAGYSGEPHSIDRKGHDPEHIERPLLTIALTVQPHVLDSLVSHPIARAQGLVARFAYALPETRLGRRQINAPAVPPEIARGWADVVRRVAKTADTTDTNSPEPNSVNSVSSFEAQKITLATRAAVLLTELQEQIEPRLAPGADLHAISDWAGRHHGRVARIAALLHLCDHPADEPISETTMRGAIRIGEYLLAHGTAALTGPDATLRSALRWLGKHDAPKVTQRDLQRGPLAGRGTSEDAARLVERLETLGAIRRAAQAERAGPGRHPSPAYEINPELRTGDNAQDESGAPA